MKVKTDPQNANRGVEDSVTCHSSEAPHNGMMATSSRAKGEKDLSFDECGKGVYCGDGRSGEVLERDVLCLNSKTIHHPWTINGEFLCLLGVKAGTVLSKDYLSNRKGTNYVIKIYDQYLEIAKSCLECTEVVIPKVVGQCNICHDTTEVCVEGTALGVCSPCVAGKQVTLCGCGQKRVGEVCKVCAYWRALLFEQDLGTAISKLAHSPASQFDNCVRMFTQDAEGSYDLTRYARDSVAAATGVYKFTLQVGKHANILKCGLLRTPVTNSDYCCLLCWESTVSNYCLQCDGVVGACACHAKMYCKRCGSFGRCGKKCKNYVHDAVIYPVLSDYIEEVSQQYDVPRNSFGICPESLKCATVLNDDISDPTWKFVDALLKPRLLVDVARECNLSSEIIAEVAARFRFQYRNRMDELRSRVVPQSFVSDVMDRVQKLVITMMDISKGIIQSGQAKTAGFWDAIVNSVSSLGKDIFSAGIDTVQNRLIDGVKDSIGRCVEGYVSFVRISVKFIVRYLFDYGIGTMLTEVLLDSDLMMLLGTQLSSVLGSISGQSSEGMGMIIGLMLFTAQRVMGLSSGAVRDFSFLARLGDQIVPTTVGDFIGKIPLFSGLFSDDRSVMMRSEWPATHAYMAFRRRMDNVVNPKPWEVRKGQTLYGAYVEEWRMMSPSDRRYFEGKRTDLTKLSWLNNPLPPTRNQPPVLYLYGKPGAGKTVSCEIILRHLHAWALKEELIDPECLYMDFAWNYIGNTKHFDGYSGQPVIVFNDFLSMKETTENSIAATFLSVVDTADMVAPMADVSKKGMYVAPIFVIVTSNLSWTQFSTLLEASNNKEAYVRRISRFYMTVPKNYDEAGKIIPGEGADQWHYVNYESPASSPGEIHNIYQLYSWCQQSMFDCVKAEKPYHVLDPMLSISEPNDKNVNEISQEVRDSVMNYIGKTVDVRPQKTKKKKFRSKDPLTGQGFAELDVEEVEPDSVGLNRELGDTNFPKFDSNFPKFEFAEEEEIPDGTWVHMVRMAKSAFSLPKRAYRNITGSIDFVWTNRSRVVYPSMLWTKRSDDERDPQEKYHEELQQLSNGVDVSSVFEGCSFLDQREYVLPEGMSWNLDAEALDELKEAQSKPQFSVAPLMGCLLAVAGLVYVTRHDTFVGKYWIRKKEERLVAETEKLKREVKNSTGETSWKRGDDDVPMMWKNNQFDFFYLPGGKKYMRQWVNGNEIFVPVNMPIGEDDLTKIKQNKKLTTEQILNKALSEHDSRFEEQVEGIMSSVYRVLKSDGTVMAHAFAISSQEVIMASHTFASVGDVLRLQSLSGVDRSFVNDENSTGFVAAVDKMIDVAYVFLHSSTLPKIPKNYNKFNSRDHTSGFVQRAGENWSEQGYMEELQTEVYPGGGEQISALVARVDISGRKGYCGLPYVRVRSSNPNRLVGIHVAGTCSGDASFVAFVSKQWIDGMRQRCSAPKPMPVRPLIEGHSSNKDYLEEIGMVVEGLAETKIFDITDSAFVRIPDLSGPGNKYWSDDYDLAKLHPFVLNGVKISPDKLRLKTFADKQKAKYGTSYGMENDVLREAARSVADYRPVDWRPSYQECVVSRSELNWTGVRREKQAGVDFGSAKKNIVFKDTQIQELTEDCLASLAVIDTRLMAGEPHSVVRGMSKKDEKLKKEKVAQGKTRLYSPEDLFCLLPSRKFLAPLILFLTNKGRHLGMMWNMTPEMLGSHMANVCKEMGFESDFEKLDVTHSFEAWVDLMKFCLMSGIFENDESVGITIHPDLPPLEPYNVARFTLLRMMALGLFQWRDVLFTMCGALGSGAFVTGAMNVVRAYCLYCRFKKRLESLVGDVDVVVMLFGDDGMVTFDKALIKLCKSKNVNLTEVWQTVHSEMGYHVTDANKGHDFPIKKVEELSFCGRFLVHNHELGNVAALELPRIVKSVQFTKKAGLVDVYPGQVAGFLREAAYHGKKVYEGLVDNLVWKNGYCIRDFGDVSYKRMVDCVVEDGMKYAEAVARKWTLVMKKPQKKRRGELIEAQGDDESSASTDAMTVMVQDAEIEPVESNASVLDYQASAPFDAGESIFARPKRIATVAWTQGVGMAAGDLLWDAYLPSAYFDNAANALMKMANNTGMRGNVKISVVLNSVSTQAGRLVLFGQPKARFPADEWEAKSGKHVCIDAGSNASGETLVRYNSELLFGWITEYGGGSESSYFDFLHVGIRVLSELRSAAASTAHIGVYVSFEEVQMIQSALTSFAITAQGSEVSDNTAGMGNTDATTMLSVGDAQVEGSIIGTQTSNTYNLSLAGFSKPTIGVNTTNVTNVPGKFMSNVTGGDSSQTMAAIHDSKGICGPDWFADDGDSMDIKRLCRREGMLTRLNWTAATAAETIMWYTLAEPGTLSQLASVKKCETPLARVCSFFRYWRGVMCYRFSLVNTGFHSGTLEISADFGTGTGAPDEEYRSFNLHRVIWDITLQKDLVVKVPYIYPTHFRNFKWVSQSDFTGGVGPAIFLKVVVPLTYASSVADNIDIIVDMWGEDFQVAWPWLSTTGMPTPPALMKELPVCDYADWKKQSNAKKRGKITPKGKGKEVLEEQGFDFEAPGSALGPFVPSSKLHDLDSEVMLGPSGAKIPGWHMAARYMGGELIENLRVCLRRFYFMKEAVYTTEVLKDTWSWDDDGLPAYMEAMKSLFVFGFGGVRIKGFIKPDWDGSTPSYVTDNWGSVILRATVDDSAGLANVAEPATVWTDPRMPFYEVTLINATPLPYFVLANQLAMPMRLKVSSSRGHKWFLYLAGADNFTMGGDNYLEEWQATMTAMPNGVPYPTP